MKSRENFKLTERTEITEKKAEHKNQNGCRRKEYIHVPYWEYWMPNLQY